jgi:sugar-specific transcriptional regulator TrmB
MLFEQLGKLGFSTKEEEVYLAILKHNKILPNDIAEYTGIKRTTVYSVINDLLNKGVIAQDLASSKKYIIALPPEDLNNIIKKEEFDLEKKKSVVNDAIQEIKQSLSNTRYTIPKIRFIGEEHLEKFLYDQSPAWNESMEKTKTSWLGFQDYTFLEHYEQWIDWYWTHAPKNINLKLITNQSPVEEKIKQEIYANRRMIKFLKSNEKFSATTWVAGDYLVLIFTNERPHYAIEIHNTALAKSQGEIINNLWNKLI